MNARPQLFTDGGCVGAYPWRSGLTWAFCVVLNGERIADGAGWIRPEELPGPEGEPNQAEFYAVMMGLAELLVLFGDDVIFDAYTDSEVTIARFAKSATLYGIPQEWRDRAYGALRRTGGSSWHHVKGHPTKKDLERGRTESGTPVSVHNVYVDSLCKIHGRLAALAVAERENQRVAGGVR